jgi:hypothetical protein
MGMTVWEAELTSGENGLDDGSDLQSLHQLQNLLVVRRKKHAQNGIGELAGC